MIPLPPYEKRMVNRFRTALNQERQPSLFEAEIRTERSSAVLFLLGASPKCGREEPCLILNKRSQDVRQAGDLCCPGGGIEPRLDNFLARLLLLPFSLLRQWPHFKTWQKNSPHALTKMTLFLATSLRESVEEMRLNPLGVTFIGPLPPQHLVMFQRTIFPMAAWISRQSNFHHNWEVEKVVRIPLRNLLNPSFYRRYLLLFESNSQPHAGGSDYALPCFLHEEDSGTEVLWGATFRITMVFLELAYGFTPPKIDSLPTIQGLLDSRYVNGKKES
jgi:hypothetical protein